MVKNERAVVKRPRSSAKAMKYVARIWQEEEWGVGGSRVSPQSKLPYLPPRRCRQRVGSGIMVGLRFLENGERHRRQRASERRAVLLRDERNQSNEDYASPLR